MSSTADPAWWLIGAVLLVGFLVGIFAASNGLVAVLAFFDRRDQTKARGVKS